MIHPSADIHPSAVIGEGTNVWQGAAVMADCVIGKGCNIGRNVEIGRGSVIGDGTRIGGVPDRPAQTSPEVLDKMIAAMPAVRDNRKKGHGPARGNTPAGGTDYGFVVNVTHQSDLLLDAVG